jgi:hypothetical protein
VGLGQGLEDEHLFGVAGLALQVPEQERFRLPQPPRLRVHQQVL